MAWADPEKKKAYQKAYHLKWYAKNREKKQQQIREWNLKNPGRQKEISRAWIKANPGKTSLYSKSYRVRHPERRERYRQDNKDKYNAYLRKWRKGPKFAAIVAKRRASLAVAEVFDREEIWKRDGGYCYLCNSPVDQNNWHMDHVVPLSRGGDHAFDNCAVTHPVCNLKKGTKTPWEMDIAC